MRKNEQSEKALKTKGFWAGLIEKLDQKLEKQAKRPCCCSTNSGKGDPCC